MSLDKSKSEMTTDISIIGNHKVRDVATGEAVEMKKFWEDKDSAIFFFRRWGCTFCRLWAKEISEIAPTLRENNIRVVGVGVEEVGSKEFLDGKFFDGELYYVEDRSTYNALGFKRFGTLSILASLFYKEARTAIAKGNRMHLGGNLTGDKVQVGGALFVKRGGEVLKHFVQTGPAEHMPNEDILKLFNLENAYKPEIMKNKSRDSVECSAPTN